MTDLRKAAEMLMKALDDGWVERGDNVAIALRQALAQPESIKPSDLLIDTYSVNLGAWSVNNRGVKITHVPTGTVVCSDSERSQHANKRVAMQKLEAALAQPKQEPVAPILLIENRDTPEERVTQLYTAPPNREWEFLGDDEVIALANKEGWNIQVEDFPANLLRLRVGALGMAIQKEFWRKNK